MEEKNQNIKIEKNDEEILIKIPQKKNYTRRDLMQRIINHLMTINEFDTAEIELAKLILKD